MQSGYYCLVWELKVNWINCVLKPLLTQLLTIGLWIGMLPKMLVFLRRGIFMLLVSNVEGLSGQISAVGRVCI